MSKVTTAILIGETGGASEVKHLPGLNERISRGTGFVAVKDPSAELQWYGGNGAFVEMVALGAFRDLDLNALVAAVRETPWDEPEYVQLFVCLPGQERFVEIAFQDTPATTAE